MVGREVGTLLQNTFGIDLNTASSLGGMAGWAGGQLADVTASAFSQTVDIDFEYADGVVCAVVAVNPGGNDEPPMYFIGVANQWIFVRPDLVQPAVQAVVYGTSTLAVLSALRVCFNGLRGSGNGFR